MQVFRIFIEDWIYRISLSATVRNLTYGVLIHEIRTSIMDMEKFEEIKENIL